MSVRLISVTPEAEKTMAYIARVSSPHQDNPEYAGLLRYCLNHRHWSVFEHASMSVEIETSRMISAQILRHRSFKFSEFSQRYAEPVDFVPIEARKPVAGNRQSSVPFSDDRIHHWWKYAQTSFWHKAQDLYKEALDAGIAKECARAVLPMFTCSRLYMTGDVRSWIHYLDLRTQPDTQKEHRDIAEAIKRIFIEQFPTVSEALGWS